MLSAALVGPGVVGVRADVTRRAVAAQREHRPPHSIADAFPPQAEHDNCQRVLGERRGKATQGPGGRAEKGGGDVWLNPTACVLSAVVVLGACSDCGQIEQRGQVSAPPANAPTSTPDPKGPVNVVTEYPRPTQSIPLLKATGTQGLSRQVWTLQEVVDNGAAVIVAVTLNPFGSDIRGATVDQAPDQVVLAVWSKATAVPPGAACPQQRVTAIMRVRLSPPLGNRRLQRSS